MYSVYRHEDLVTIWFQSINIFSINCSEIQLRNFCRGAAFRMGIVQMEPFGCSSSSVRAGRKVISSVSLGLTTSAPSGGARVSHVQQKARVLVEERFHIVSQQPDANAGMSVRPPPPRRPPLPTSNNGNSLC